jgi:uncharacterized protein YprB with RNaseH-like and TPR domain
MRVALVSTYTCQGCCHYDASHGRSRFGLAHGHCAACQRAIRHRKRQVAICPWTKAYRDNSGFVVLDTETIGFSSKDAVIVLVIVYASGSVLFSSLIQLENT